MSSNPFAEFEVIRVEDRGPMRLATINRPAKANALNSTALAELEAVVDATSGNDAIRLFAITGAGEKVFCAGADLFEATGQNSKSDSAMANDQRWDALTARIAALPCFTVALVNGACIGGGLSVVLAFDYRLGARHAYFRYPVAKHGFMPSVADLARLKAIAGRSVTRKLLVLGQAIAMPAALEAGLLDELVDEGGAWKTVDTLAEQVMDGQATSQLATKRLLTQDGASPEVIDLCYRAVYDMDHDAIAELRTLGAE
ncbi:enoyl-CoA hydratase/isomerase family protein [Shinella sp. BYT-45]|uniref:enoyl-CoA hydratase/isomerase family protein n=1 Tax=Shinella sp. BYT-45 TaxID=3377377 RepID=UPI0039805EA9